MPDHRPHEGSGIENSIHTVRIPATGQVAAPDVAAAAADDAATTRLVCVGRYVDRAAAWERGLVVLAMGLPCWVIPTDADGAGETALCVEPDVSSMVARQLALFEEENRPGARAPVGLAEESDRAAGSWLLQLLMAGGVLGGVYALADTGAQALGRLDAVAIFHDGAWWRPLTALTLHADGGHLSANVAALTLFAHFVARRLGSGVGWWWIVLAGVLGNLATAWLFRETGHLSLGASTAVFAALGLLAGVRLAPRRPAEPDRGRRTAMPRRILSLVAAGVLLGWLGAGGGQTDVVAHLMGFVAGVISGAVAASVTSGRPGAVVQWAAGSATLAIILAAWFGALSA